MTPESTFLVDLATTVAEPYTHLPDLRAAMVTGSAAKGIADAYSDIDMTMYYDGDIPDEATLHTIRESLGGSERKWTLGDRASGWFAESFHLRSVEVQIGHTTIDAWEQTIADTLAGENLTSAAQKAMEGTLNSITLFGAPLMDAWREQIRAYPAELGEMMIAHHLKFFPLWGLQPHFQSRDATLWFYKSLVEACENIVAILAGLNKLYFTTFQFKRQRYFFDQMALKPDRLAERIEALFSSELAVSAELLEQLVADTIALVEQEHPDIDTTEAKRRLGWRQGPWSTPAPPS